MDNPNDISSSGQPGMVLTRKGLQALFLMNPEFFGQEISGAHGSVERLRRSIERLNVADLQGGKRAEFSFIEETGTVIMSFFEHGAKEPALQLPPEEIVEELKTNEKLVTGDRPITSFIVDVVI